jgi:hypothetical protein
MPTAMDAMGSKWILPSSLSKKKIIAVGAARCNKLSITRFGQKADEKGRKEPNKNRDVKIIAQ